MPDVRLPPWVPAGIRTVATRRVLQPKETLFETGGAVHSIFWLRSGGVRLLRADYAGLDVTLQNHRAGEFLAEGSVLSERYHCDGIAIGPATLSQVPKAAFVEALRNDPVFSGHWLSHVTGALREARAKLACMHLKTAEERILFSLSLTADADGRVEIQEPLFHWARELGLAHETVYRTLGSMERSGQIKRRGRKVHILAADNEARL